MRPKTLIVNNNTKHIKAIKKLCSDLGYNSNVIKWDKLKPSDYKKFDLIILSGGTGMAIDKHEKDFKNEIELIKKSNKPIIGFCLGFELICYVFGCTMIRENQAEKGIVKIKAIKKHKIFANKKTFKVYMSHKWHVKKINSSNLIILAKSTKGIDIVKHKDRFIYGFQFHPEIVKPLNNGADIFNNCLELI